MDMYENSLFMELGEVVGHDPNLYEDTPKQLPLNLPFPSDASNLNSYNWTEKNPLLGLESLDDGIFPGNLIIYAEFISSRVS